MTKQPTLRQINANIQKAVDARIELVRGEGYHYFVWNDQAGGRAVYETKSIMVAYTSSMSLLLWVDEARAFRAEVYIKRYDTETEVPDTANAARTEDATRPKEVFTRVLYSDGSGARLEVTEGFVLQGPDKTVRIKAVGGDAVVFVEDIDHLIAALTAAKRFFELED